ISFYITCFGCEISSKPQFCSAIAITNSEQAGAAITEDGLVYSWGAAAYGGTGYGSSSKRPGAQPVLGLPDPTIEGNRPVEVSGGYQTIWVILENGDVYYFGKSGGLWERPALDDQGYPDGNQPSWSGEGNKKTVEVYAKKSVSLKDWFRENNPGEYIVHIHSGIGFGAAVLSTGRVLSWGYGHGSALGRTCTDYGKAGDPCDQNFPASYTGEDGMTHEGWGGLRQGRMPGYVALPADTRIVGQACAFTAAVGLADNGDLWAWAKVDSYENVGSVKPVNPEDEEEVEGEDKPTGGGDPDDDGSFDDGMADFRNGAARLATNVEEFQVGQGYILWRKADGQWWGQGYNPRGSVGHKASMLSSGAAGYKYAHELWFAGKDYSSCTKTKNNTPDDATIDLTAGGCGNKTKNEAINAKDTATPGAWSHRFSLQQFVAAKGTLN
ncbi:MAG: hypothetical protein LBD70_02960, partial [Bifidobacteriaceae bacterium]|nr:hypothetical protein [Bifidobacteriaceae bacterium]